MSFNGFAKGFGKAITKIGDATADSIRNITNKGYAGDAVEKLYDKVVRPVGKKAFDTSLKVGASTLEDVANVVDHVRNHAGDYKRTGKAVLGFGKKVAGDAVKEGNELVHAAYGAAELLERMHIITDTGGDFSKSLLGYKFTPGAKWGAVAIALGAGAVDSTKDYMTNRTGRNDGRTYGVTPSMTNPYQLSQQVAYSQMGQSFSNNAGADGDLIRALSNMR
jgi:hypothetical protein